MTYLAQSLAVTQARGSPHAGSFSGVMTGLRKACGLMSEGFQQACLDVEVVVQKTIEEATAHEWAFTAKAAKDLDLWTSALQQLFDTDEVTEADMETQRAHAWHTRQVVSDRIPARFICCIYIGSGDPIRVLCLSHNEYAGYTLKHLLLRHMYNLSLPKLRATLLVGLL